MALGKRLINTGAAAAVCNTESVQAFGADIAFSSNVALYQLDGDGGVTNNVPDTTTNYDGTASNVTYTTGQFGNAGVFNGSSSYINASSLTYLFDSKATATVSLWFNTSTTATTSVLFSDYASSTARNFLVSINSTGNIVWNTRYGSGTGRDSNITTTSTYNDGNWHHIVLSIDQTANAKSMYVDGLQIGSSIALPTATGASFDSTQRVTIGSSYNTGTSAYQDYYNGKIDQVRIFDREITPEEVSTLYNETTSTASNTNPLSDGSGVALYSLDYDASDAGGLYDGTPTNVDFGVDGQINYGARFNGSAYVTYNSFLSTTTDNSSASFSIWVKFNSFSSTQAISSGLSGQSPPFNLYVYHSGGTSTFAIERGFGGTIYYSSTYNTEIQASTSVDTWYHIVYTYTASTKAIEVFLNGNSIGTDTLNTSASGTINPTQLLGGINSGGSIDADLDQYRIFSKALNF
jgi:hypothetical protein